MSRRAGSRPSGRPRTASRPAGKISSGSVWTGSGWLALALLTLSAALPRLWRLGDPGLWLDEAMSFHFARLGPAALFEALRLDSGPPLYYLILGFWQRLFGAGETALRSLSAVAGIALVPALVWVGRSWAASGTPASGSPGSGEPDAGRSGAGKTAILDFGAGAVGWWAAALAAVAPLHVAASREARVYALTALVALLAAETWRRWSAGSKTAYRCYFALAATLPYLHNYGLFVLGAIVLASALVAAGVGERFRRAALAAAPLLLYLPWIPTLLAQLGQKAPTAWMEEVWRSHGALGSLWASVRVLGPGGMRPAYAGFAPLAPRPVLEVLGGILLLGLLAAGLWALRRGGDGGAPPLRIPGSWPAVLAATPLLAAWILSLLGRPIYLPARLEILVFPFVCLLAGRGLAALRPAALRWFLFGGWGALALVSLAGSLAALDGARDAPPGDRELGRAVVEAVQPGTTVIATSLTYAGLEHALREAPGSVELVAFPGEQARHPGNESPEAQAARQPEIRREARELASRLEGRVVLALVPNAAGLELIRALAGDPRRPRSREAGRYALDRLGLPVNLLVIDLEGGPGRSR